MVLAHSKHRAKLQQQQQQQHSMLVWGTSSSTAWLTTNSSGSSSSSSSSAFVLFFSQHAHLGHLQVHCLAHIEVEDVPKGGVRHKHNGAVINTPELTDGQACMCGTAGRRQLAWRTAVMQQFAAVSASMGDAAARVLMQHPAYNAT
jgi:hypothetical protein